ncbi:hypothetical protein [Vibrio splendidus]|uniref:hypothetical protein n=1 Tax=Vibrio splendidus TaxID=29497 RepID=UPI000808EFE6|nr:hypothetical protein [Vibrio splendidus]SBS66007.1 hypothetical protein VHE8714_03046 [Vibrio splendidus]
MSKNVEWLARLNRDSKGIWGLIHQSSCTRALVSLEESIDNNCEYLALYPSCDDFPLSFTSEEDEDALGLDEISKRMINQARDFQRSFARIVIYDFDRLSLSSQCTVIKNARSIQESESDFVSIQFVFCGSWNYFSFREKYFEINGKSSSPAAELKNIIYVPSHNLESLLELMLEKNLIGKYCTEIQRIAAEYLIEQVGGSDFLLTEAIEYLIDKEGDWVDNIEQVLEELVVAPKIVEKYKILVGGLDCYSKDELIKTLRVQRITRQLESRAIEQLWLLGFIDKYNLDRKKYQVNISGYVTSGVLRNIAEESGLGIVAPSEELCIRSSVISSYAYKKVAELENLLRSLLVSEWYQNSKDEWRENLKATKASPYRDDQEHLIKLVISCIKEEFPAISSNVEKSQVDNVQESRGRKSSHTSTILDSALDWQKRQNEHHGIELGKNNIMHFLTTESLIQVIKGRNKGIVGDGKVFKKDYFSATLDEYVAIRSAVAHNQPILLDTILRLNEILRKISDWTTVYADKAIQKVDE